LPLSYSITIKRSAEKDLNKLPKNDRDKAVKIILGLAENPRPKGCAKLKFKEGWRVRFGDYRIIFEINDSDRKITVIGVKHRRETYRR
jgi:mRNA interferase RelE/StbE